ncbi:MAG: glycerate kinase [Desulfomonilaceae bacterium]
MRVIIAPDSYKGSLSAVEVAKAIRKGIHQIFQQAEIIEVPIADGGEGTVEALVVATGGKIVPERVKGPLGNPVESFWGILGDNRTAVIEMAAASGLPLVPAGKRDPRIASSYGTGQLIKSALDNGFRKLILGIGGSATNDGGAGMAQALGVKFMDANGRELAPGGAELSRLTEINLDLLDPRLKESEIVVACDVDNPLFGPRGASAVYGPQKGATPEMVPELDNALKNFAEIAGKATGRLIADVPGAGAAGGMGAGLLFFTPAVLRTGVEIVFEAVGLASLIRSADIVITGEGRTDYQTAFGKAPVGVGKLAKQFNKVAICISGSLGRGADDILDQGINAVVSIVPAPMKLEECMKSAPELVEKAANRVARLLKAGASLVGQGNLEKRA